MLAHHRLLGQLRKNNEALRLGTTEFFQAGEGRIGFTRCHDLQRIRIYVNHSNAPWDIPAGKVLYGHNLNTLAPNWLSLSPMGFCITED